MGKGYELRECLGILRKDREWEELEKEIKKAWKNWSKKYYIKDENQTENK